MFPGVNCVFLHVALQTFYNRKENIGEKGHNSTVGGKVFVEKKNQANCKTGQNTHLAKVIF
jgi:hypothetical protein